MARGYRITPLQIRLACAAALLALGMTTLLAGARLGVVHLNAGEMQIVFGGGEKGLTLDMASRGCPPDCNFAINWRPATARTATEL